MREAEVPVTFRPMDKTAYALKGTGLAEAAAGAGVVLDQPCGGVGKCGKCRVLVADGAVEPTPAEIAQLPADQLQSGYRLACQSTIAGPMTVEVPEASLLASHHQILAGTGPTSWEVADDPPVRKQYVELPPPARGDDAADLMRLERAIGPFRVDLELLRSLPGRLRASGFRGTAVLSDRRLIDFEPQNTENETFGVAVDVGTTTLAAVLLNLDPSRPRRQRSESDVLDEGGELAVVTRLNPQTQVGDDVLSRIHHVQQDPNGLAHLRDLVVRAVDEMIGELADRVGIGRERIYEVTFSGNTTMQQLLCGIDPSSLGEVPFTPASGRGLELSAGEMGLHLHPRATACVLPVIGGFVGGDTVAGILATGMAAGPGPTLLIDIGTNGEIVLFAGGKLSAASTAAGPAFEGARIGHGMRGSQGAIEKVVFDDCLRINVIGNVRPIGLCGSGLIDVAAELLRHGALTSLGRLLPPDQLPEHTPRELARRIMLCEGQTAFLLAAETETGHGQPIVLTQRDVRELQLATGAIRAGAEVLLRRAGLGPDDLQAILLAGGFGNFIRRSNAQRIGLISPKVPRPRIRYQGNTSLAGARMVAVSRRARASAEDLARRTEHVDLSCNVGFHAAFAEAMIFPADDGEIGR